ncbi:MAG TPA: hypothetical protein VI731_12660 [Bacteroidia bacterium]|nr:hypothetical protein [Bacteroidia bacterium]
MNNYEKLLAEKAKNDELLRARLDVQGDHGHHYEEVVERNGVTWINHSIATNIELTWAALYDVPGPVLLIIGGKDGAKNPEKIEGLVAEKVDTIICLGTAHWKYFNAFLDSAAMIVQASGLAEAVDFAAILVNERIKTVLFAPGCPGSDPLENYRNRGNSFRKLIKEKFEK